MFSWRKYLINFREFLSNLNIMEVYKIVKFSQILSSLLIYEVLIQSNKYISFMPIIHSSLSHFLQHFLTFYLVYVPSWYYDICSFHMSISLYQCCKPQVALGSNAIPSLNFVLVILHFQISGHVLQERERVVQDSPCSKYPEKVLVPILS